MKQCLKRVESAEKYAHKLDCNWREVIFTDEKSFIMDVPDGLKSYWHGSRLETCYFSRRQNNGSPIMDKGLLVAGERLSCAI